jgi:hypothetical protein
MPHSSEGAVKVAFRQQIFLARSREEREAKAFYGFCRAFAFCCTFA